MFAYRLGVSYWERLRLVIYVKQTLGQSDGITCAFTFPYFIHYLPFGSWQIATYSTGDNSVAE
jgi:hypothetical protein